MAADLDRAYLINGDDLRIGLQRADIAHTDDLAEYLLNFAGKPLDEFPGSVIRVEQLAQWFREHEFGTCGHTGDSYGKAAYPEALAETILEDITGQAHPMPVDAEIAEPEPCPFHLGNGAAGECNCELKKYALAAPGYYDGKGGMQPFDVIDAFGLDFYEGNVVKYLVRWRKKNGLEDLYKARTYLNRIIARAEAEQ